MSDANLFAQQAANRRRSVWLVAGFLLFFAWVGFGGDYAFYLLTADAPPGAYRHTLPFIGLLKQRTEIVPLSSATLTLTFVPKIVAVFVATVIFLPFMMTTLIEFSHGLFERIAAIG